MTLLPRHSARRVFIVVAVLSQAWLAPQALAQPSYRLVALAEDGTPRGPATDVSDTGIVVGHVGAVGAGYLWTAASGFERIGDAAVQAVFPYYSYFPPALAVNASGAVAGNGARPGGGAPGPAMWSTATGYVFLPGNQPAEGGAARAINAAGTIVGLYHGNAQRPFIWRTATGMQYIPGFNIAGGSDAFDINDADAVVGRAGGGTCGAGSSAFVWTEASGITCLPRVHADAPHEALAISNTGIVAGRFEAGATSTPGVFTWTSATGTVDLLAPAGIPYFVDVNDSGDVVATILIAGVPTPFLRPSGGSWVNVNTLLPPGSDLVLRTVRGINNDGWLVGDAGPTPSGGFGWLLIPPVATTTALSSTPNPSGIGSPVTFTATVQAGGTPVTGGTVTVREGTMTLAGPLAVNASGQASFSTSVLSLGPHAIQASYSGAPGYLASSGATTHTVNPLTPTSANDSYATPYGTPLTVSAPGVLANDVTNGGGAMSASVVAATAHGTLAMNGNGGFVYTPVAGFSGTDSFTYRATNSAGPGNIATVTIVVSPAPTVTTVASLPNPSTIGGGVSFMAAVLVGMTPVTAGSVTFREGTTVLAGPLPVDVVGHVSFVTNALSIGAHTVEAVYGGTATLQPSSGTVIHTVNPAPPTTIDDTYPTAFRTTLTVPAPGVLGNDDTGGAPSLTAELLTNPSHGTLAFVANGSFTYVPDPTFAGTDSFTYRAVSSTSPGAAATVTVTVIPPTTVQGPTDLYVSAIHGNDVTFRWTAAPLGPAPEQFVLTGGAAPGQVLATLPTGSAYPIVTVKVPPGAYYARIQAVAGGQVSVPSNEVRVFVGTATPPSPPADLLGTVVGQSLALSWRTTFEGAAPTGMWLDVAGSVNDRLLIGPGETFSFSPVPAGSYTLSVRAANDAGTSAPSNRVTLTFPSACSGAPLAPIRFLAYRVGRRVSVVWDPAASGPAPTAFVLSVTGSIVAEVPTAERTVSGEVPAGSYELRVRAVNACGSSPATPVQTVDVS